MTPRLAFFCGGLVGRKNVLAIMIQSFVSMGWTTVLWWAFGFSLCFSGDMKSGSDFAGIVGSFHWAFLRGITLDMPSPINPTIPMIVFCAYQMMFAIITPALITGAFANRVTFKAYMLFLTAWLVLVCFYAVALKNRLGWDDALDVWGVHGVGGLIGIVMCGVFATTAFNPAGVDGLLRGNSHFFLVECAAVLVSSVWAFVFSYGMLWLIDRITPVKVDEAGESTGLDMALHGESAYLEGV